jgi:hypothetical protein
MIRAFIFIGVALILAGSYHYLKYEPEYSALAARKVPFVPNFRPAPGAVATEPFTFADQDALDSYVNALSSAKTAMAIGGLILLATAGYLFVQRIRAPKTS